MGSTTKKKSMSTELAKALKVLKKLQKKHYGVVETED